MRKPLRDPSDPASNSLSDQDTHLTGEFWAPLDDRLARLLPIFAIGHHDGRVREFAAKLFEKLFMFDPAAL